MLQKERTAPNRRMKKWQRKISVLKFKIMGMGKTILCKQQWSLNWL